jgi:hypothetical protein
MNPGDEHLSGFTGEKKILISKADIAKPIL